MGEYIMHFHETGTQIDKANEPYQVYNDRHSCHIIYNIQESIKTKLASFSNLHFSLHNVQTE